MRRAIMLAIMLCGMLMLSSRVDAASCTLTASGNQRDVFNNVVWSGGSSGSVGDYANNWECGNTALNAFLTYARQICLNHRSAVGINMTADVYFGGVWYAAYFVPGTCRTQFNLNHYAALGSGQSLNPGDSISSGGYELRYQTDANLVLYNGSTAEWAINCWPTCNPIGNAGVTTMQSDGNFVVYDDVGNAVFNTGTQGNNGAFLALRSGQLLIFSTTGNVLWQAP